MHANFIGLNRLLTLNEENPITHLICDWRTDLRPEKNTVFIIYLLNQYNYK